MAWHHLQYVLGLHRLGHDVWFLEDSDDYPACYDPSTNVTGTDPTFGLAFATGVFDRVGLAERWAYFDAHTGRWLGPAAGCAHHVLASADVVLNVSGVNPLREPSDRVPTRVFVDTDPLFVQIRNLTDVHHRARTEQHTAWFSFGENIGAGRSSVPDDGFRWEPTRQPVVLDAWEPSSGPRDGAFTTLMQWTSYDAVEHEGHLYGMKAHSFPPFEELPRSSRERFELALGSADAPRQRLRQAGWSVVDPASVSSDPWAYQRYIRRSKGEFGLAKQGYVDACTGWFSERTANYLASGRPAVVQDTGFSHWLPTGRGLFAVSTLEEAAEAVRSIDGAYEAHCRWARELAVEHFDARVVLTDLMDSL